MTPIYGGGFETAFHTLSTGFEQAMHPTSLLHAAHPGIKNAASVGGALSECDGLLGQGGLGLFGLQRLPDQRYLAAQYTVTAEFVGDARTAIQHR